MSCRLVHSELRRGRKRVLAPADLTLPVGSRVAVIGANGAGKSTLFLALAGVLRRRGGTASVPGPEHARIAFMPQQPAMPRWLTTGEAIELYGGLPAARTAVTGALQLQDLLPRRVGTLSGGELQAVQLAATIARAADVLILDEPFAHLDFRRRLGAIELMRRDPTARWLTFVSSQNAADLVTFCHWYLVLAHGRAVFSGSLDELLNAPEVAAEHRLPLIESRLVALLE